MKDNVIVLIHQKLNQIYTQAESTYHELKKEGYSISYGYYNQNYIKINGKQVLQKYPIPIITIEGIGDIGFNLDEVFFEFFIDRNEIKKIDLKALIEEYRLEIYGGKNCLIDFYTPPQTEHDVIKQVLSSSEETIGIAVYIQDLNIKSTYLHLCQLLKL